MTLCLYVVKKIILLHSYHRKEQGLFTSLLSVLYSHTDAWIGLVFDSSDSTYKWENGESVSYTKWVNRQPDPSQGSYAKVGVNGYGVQPMLWKPALKEEKLPFFCQRMTGS